MKSNIIKSLGIFILSLVVLSACRNDDNLIESTCFDEVQNQGELRVDCGGPNCAECPPACDDRLQNQGEQSPVSATNPNVVGIDCGGDVCEPCSSCNDGIQNAHWVKNINLGPSDMNSPNVAQDENGDYYSLIMESGIDCGFPCPNVCVPNCDDDIQNGDETGIDCGGTCTNPCPPAACGDGIQNGDETGIDCGNDLCGPCAPQTCTDGIQNIHIEVSDDYLNGYIVVVETGIDCDNNPQTMCPDCPLPTCFDGILNGSETGIDCGGSCFTQCDVTVSCNNGIMDGNEVGIDCDLDDTTDCPPCAVCGDEFLNGPEFDVDCVDYLIPEYPCPVCFSCHDGEFNSIYNAADESGMMEQDVDCGDIGCEPCLQELYVDEIGAEGNTSEYRDQYSYNRLRAENGQDTLNLGASYPGFKKQLLDGHYVVTTHQGFMTQNSGILIRKLVLHMPIPHSVIPDNPFYGPAVSVDMEDSEPQFGCEAAFGQDVPYFVYQEFLADDPGGTGSSCFFSYVDGGENSSLSFDYMVGYVETSRYVKGGIDSGSMLWEPQTFPASDEVEGEYSGLQFKFTYPYFL